MSTEEENVTSYEGFNEVTILNGRPSEITDVRVIHFGSNSWPTELFIQGKMAPNEKAKKVFHSRASITDHWAVTFQIGENGYMSKDLTANMKTSEQYTLTIGPTDLEFSRSNGENRSTSKITYVYDCIKA